MYIKVLLAQHLHDITKNCQLHRLKYALFSGAKEAKKVVRSRTALLTRSFSSKIFMSFSSYFNHSAYYTSVNVYRIKKERKTLGAII